MADREMIDTTAARHRGKSNGASKHSRKFDGYNTDHVARQKMQQAADDDENINYAELNEEFGGGSISGKSSVLAQILLCSHKQTKRTRSETI